MKIKQFIAPAILFLGSVMLLSGCVKETFPEGGSVTTDQKESDSFEDATATVSTILITNYDDITGEHYEYGYAAMFGITDRMVGEIFPVAGNMPGGNQYYDRFQPWLYYSGLSLAPPYAPAAFIYRSYYAFIHEANIAIAIATGRDDMKESLGVAKTFRALYFLDLARLYDPLPAKAPNKPSYEAGLAAVEGLTVPKSVEGMTMEELENNPRMTREEIFTFIFEDLDEAETLLAEYAPRSKNLPSLAVVYGLKARAYLWLGGFTEGTGALPNGEAAYRKAAEFANKAITEAGGAVTTEAQWTDPKTGFNTVIPSWMWAMIQSESTVLNNLLSFTAHHSVEAIYGYGSKAQPGMSIFSYNRMAPGDFRKKVVVSPDRNFAALAPYTNYTEAEFEGDGLSSPIAPLAVLKFRPKEGEKSNFTVANATSIPMMRVEEMMLIEAEATAHYDAGTGASLLEAFMAKRATGYTVPNGVDLIDEIIFQKRMEFWGEGIVAYDFKRLDMSMHNGDEGSNAPAGNLYTTEGRSPVWNFVIPLSAEQQNKGMMGKNNPDPSQTLKSADE
ncbi:MAG: RagB/SusD family nutrient uptake outer membrane protein [Alistipes sp.]|jgi:hypothetical protein|nr:RagB/SusD family nutrient uptake outer membrane protein [Alistipes sp.]